MLINNPWNFEFCLDRDEQRVDNLFENGTLEYLEGNSNFYFKISPLDGNNLDAR